jgi:hypothetical protein
MSSGRRMAAAMTSHHHHVSFGVRAGSPSNFQMADLAGETKPPVKRATRRRQLKLIRTPSVEFEVLIGFASRYHAWKYQVSPACTATLPAG